MCDEHALGKNDPTLSEGPVQGVRPTHLTIAPLYVTKFWFCIQNFHLERRCIVGYTVGNLV